MTFPSAKAFYQAQQPFMIKVLNKTGAEKTYLNLINFHVSNLIDNVILDERKVRNIFFKICNEKRGSMTSILTQYSALSLL